MQMTSYYASKWLQRLCKEDFMKLSREVGVG